MGELLGNQPAGEWVSQAMARAGMRGSDAAVMLIESMVQEADAQIKTAFAAEHGKRSFGDLLQRALALSKGDAITIAGLMLARAECGLWPWCYIWKKDPIHSMDDRRKMSFTLVGDLVKQLLTVATAVLALGATLAKEVFADSGPWTKTLMVAVAGVFFISIILGILSLSALTGSLDSSLPRVSRKTAVFHMGQTLTFLAACLGLLIVIGTVLWKA